jgi:hypothetical protein
LHVSDKHALFVFEAEGGDNIFVCNVGICSYLAVYMALKRRTISLSTIHVKWIPCHHGMERPQDADIEESLQVRMVARNILLKNSREQPTMGGDPALVGRGMILTVEKQPFTKCYIQSRRALVNGEIKLRVS